MADETVYQIKIDDKAAGILNAINRANLLVGDGAMQRVDLLNALDEKIQAYRKEHAEVIKSAEAGEKVDLPDFSCELSIKSSTLKAWIAGSSAAIMHTSTDGKRLHDSEVALIMEGAKSLKILKALRDRVPTYKPDDKVLELDDVPALVFDEAIPE